MNHAEAFVQLDHQGSWAVCSSGVAKRRSHSQSPLPSQSRSDLQCSFVQRDRLTIGVAGLGLAAGAQVIVEGRLPLLGQQVVARQQRQLLIQPLGVQLLDPAGHAAVQLTPTRVQDRLIRHIAGQRVAKQIGQIALDLLGQNQLGLGELLEPIEQPIVAGDHAGEHRVGEAPADHSGDLQHLAAAILQPIQPRGDHALDAIRHGRLVQRASQPPATGIARQRAGFDQAAHHFFDKERVALRALDQRGQLGRRLAQQQRAHQVDAAIGRKLAHLDPRAIIQLAPRLGDRWIHAVAQQQQQRRLRRAAHQPAQQIERRGVGPVQVVDDQHQRAVAGLGQDQRLDQLLCAVVALLGRQRCGQRRIIERDPQQVAQQWCEARQIRRQLGHAALDNRQLLRPNLRPGAS